MADESDEQPRRLISLALAALAAVGWLAAGFIGWQGAQTRSQLTGQFDGRGKGARVPRHGPAKSRKGSRRRRGAQEAGHRRRKGAVGRVRRESVGAK